MRRSKVVGKGRLGGWRGYAAATLLGLMLVCSGCGGSSGSSPAPAAPQALVVGSAAGTVLQTIQGRYRTVPGTGSEDPSPYAMIIFDGNNTTSAQLQANPGAQSFLSVGKPVVILNETENHLSTGLSGIAWASARPLVPTSPAVAFVLRHDNNNGPQELTQVDFPIHLQAAAPGQEPPLLLTPTPAQLLQDSASWLTQLNHMVEAPGNIGPAVTGNGQTVLSFDHVIPLEITEPTILEYATAVSGGAPYATSWGPNGSTPPSCDPSEPSSASNWCTQLSGTFETLVYAMLEGNSTTTYQHKIFARQYLLVSPPSPLPNFSVQQYPIQGSNSSWTFPVPARTTFGWNSSFNLSAQLENVPSGTSLSVTENKPESQNGVVSLTTSESHTETVGVSATGGIQNANVLGTVGVSWSDSWTWGQAQSVSFQDWEAQSCIGEITDGECNSGGNLGAWYYFAAFAGSELTDAVLRSSSNILDIPWNNGQLNSVASIAYSSPPSLNQLQTSAMTNHSETAWETSTGNLLPPQSITLNSDAIIYSGELDNVFGSQGPFFGAVFYLDNAFTSWLTTEIPESIALNFGASGLQPAGWSPSQQTSVDAPWTLTFAQPSPSGSRWQAAGTLTLDSAESSPTTINLTYVIQPRATMLTLPAIGVCPGTTNTFPAGPGVISNNPLSVTIPAGQTQTSLAPLFEAEGEPYNVQIIAWQAQTTVDGQQVINPQAAYCVTVPGQQP